MPTHKKGHDKDKYYHLAKDQGYRSRAAYKLIQINKRVDFLGKARVAIDLCAAPGGWCQVAAKLMPPGSIILGVDLLPIKAIRNVKTIVSDITTAACRKSIVSELNGWKADVVLCDGAPNIGSAYKKDALVQNELVLAALKTATDHLVAGGTFCTKVYRSVDYNAILWVLQQLFEEVQTIKPNSSRSQSSEIFLLCLKYTAPTFVDPKLLDANHVFREVVDDSAPMVDVFHKKYDQINKRKRTGYDESLGMLLTKSASVSDFIKSKEPIKLLSSVNKLEFSEECASFKDHIRTSVDIVESFSDLKVLGKSDFKKLLKWRLKLREEINLDERSVAQSKAVASDEDSDLSDDAERDIDNALHRQFQTQRRELKKMRKLAATERERHSLGMSGNAFGGGDVHDMELFQLSGRATVDDLDQIRDVDLHRNDVDLAIDSEDERAQFESSLVQDESDAESDATARLEQQLESDYNRFLIKRRSLKAKALAETDKELATNGQNIGDDRTASKKRMKRELEPSSLMQQQTLQDEALIGNGERHSSSSSDEDSDDLATDDDSVAEDEAENSSARPKKRAVIFDRQSENNNAAAWFKHPIFQTKLAAASSAGVTEDEDKTTLNVESEEMLRNMPLTDRERRKLKRKHDTERRVRRQEKRAKLLERDLGKEQSALSADFEVAPSGNGRTATVDADSDSDQAMLHSGDTGFEIVPQDTSASLARHDNRRYDSDSEDYDQHDRAVTLALGTMMLRNSRKKALVDAAYNRFAFNDPRELPSWFVDDEMRHNKPQVPVPNALLEQIKSRYTRTGTKEIKKVAEARARKHKRAVAKLKSAKKKATAMAENSDLSEKQKLKAIDRAMRSTKLEKAGKVYVVTKKTGSASSGTAVSSGKGKLKFVDRRMKTELRAERVRKRRGKK